MTEQKHTEADECLDHLLQSDEWKIFMALLRAADEQLHAPPQPETLEKPE